MINLATLRGGFFISICITPKTAIFASMELRLLIKPFASLTTAELYEIMKARAEVFVVEQQILYNDMDDTDYRAIHIALLDGKTVIAYARAFLEEGHWHIGRVLTTIRGKGYGIKVMNAAIEELRRRGAHQIVLDSQEYAIGFYKKLHFEVCSDLFDIDGIPHVKMTLRLD